MEILLTPWDKLAIMAIAALVVALTFLIVVCFVTPVCWLHNVFVNNAPKSLSWRTNYTMYGTTTAAKGGEKGEDKEYLWNEEKSKPSGSSWFTWLRTDSQKTKATASTNEVLSAESAETSSIFSPSIFFGEKTLCPTDSFEKTSSYSSLSSGGDSRHSPPSETNMSIKSAFSSLSIKKRFRNGSFGEESHVSQDKAELSGVNVGLYWRIPPAGETSGKLSITVLSCQDLPHRDYGAAVDSYIAVSVLKDRGRSLRRRNNQPQCFGEWKTKTVRHSSNPIFDQTFSVNIPESDLKAIRIKLTAFDVDRHTKTTELGSGTITLREIKLLMNNILDERITTTSFLAQKKIEFGELLFGMSYLPTAQRMSFSIVKASNLKYEFVTTSVDAFCPYVRILQLGSNRRIVKKKRTGIKKGRRDPSFNETLNFELSPQQLEHATFVILINHRQNAIELQEMEAFREDSFEDAFDDDRSGRDPCLGRISIGRKVVGAKELSHWSNVVLNPRTVYSTWQTLH